MAELRLSGCTPEPLMNYLKALGVFRLVAEQADPSATMSWRGGVAYLHSTLDRDDLITFFTERYQPTPIVGPWGARSGFYPGSSESSARGALDSIVCAAATEPRLHSFGIAIQSVRTLLARYGYDQKVKDDDKLTLMRICRNELPEEVVQWLDAVFVLTDDSRRFPPLLGTGGNEGSGSYVSTFAQVVCSLLIEHDNDEGIVNAIFGEFASKVGGLAVGHFHPGAIDGANSSQGFDGGGGANSWDYLLAIEGCLLFAGAAVRRYGAERMALTAFPFCVDAVAVGYASESDKEAGEGTRAELWLPLWSASVTLSELSNLLAEGRAQLSRRQARNAVEFALSVATLGVSRGIESFVRFAFVKRNGLSFLAAPLGRFTVTSRPRARLLDDPPITEWLERWRRACSDKDKTPARYQSALRQIDRSMFAFANRSEHGNDESFLLNVLIALGNAERTLSRGLRFAADKYLRPLQGLSRQWLAQADDGSAEFRLASAVAGIRGQREGIGPFRAFLEEVDVTNFVSWSPGSTSAVWSNRTLEANLGAVFRRRQMEAFRAGQRHAPLSSARPARLADVIAFLHSETDDEKLTSLLWALPALSWSDVEFKLPETTSAIDVAVPFEFGVMRLVVEPLSLIADGEEWTIREAGDSTQPDPDVFAVLASGRPTAVQAALDRAACRLKSGAWTIIGHRNRQYAGKPVNGFSASVTPERLLAAMLFPLANRDLEQIANLVLYPPENEE